MAKLADYQRDKIRNAIMTETFADRAKELKKREAALATKVILDRYGPTAFEQFAAIPEGWLPTLKQVQVSTPANSRQLALEEARTLPAELYKPIEVRPHLVRQVVRLDMDADALRTDRETLNSKLRGALRQFKTDVELRERWPEAFVHLGTPSPHAIPVPMVRPEDLNAEIARLREVA